MPDEGKEDYAVRAAREWLDVRYDFSAEHTAICERCTAQLEELAAIIRKHVAERCREIGLAPAVITNLLPSR